MSYYAAARGGRVRDREWVRKSFLMASQNNTDPKEKLWRLQTTATQKFTSTRLGGNFTINNPPQYTRYADIRSKGLNSAAQKTVGVGLLRGENIGMGRFYSEHIDDRSHQIYLQFGVPEFNGMVSFFTSFFDGNASLLASEGRSSFFYTLGKAAGTVLNVAVMIAFPWLMVGMAGMAAIRFFADNPSSKYYYMRPAMELYWQRCNFITNMIATNMGLVPRVKSALGIDLSPDEALIKEDEAAYSEQYNQYMHEIAPDIFRESGGIDLYAVSNKAQRIADERYKKIIEIAGKNQTHEQRITALQKYIDQKVTDPGGKTMDEALTEYFKSDSGNLENRRTDPAGTRLNDANTDISQLDAEAATADQAAQAKATETSTSMRNKWTNVKDPGKTSEQQVSQGWIGKFVDAYIANRRDAHQFIGYRVNNTGTLGESFSSSVKDSDISGKINGFSSSARSARFSFSEGNTGIGIIDEVKSSVANFVSGGLDAIHMSGILALAGSAFADIPKHFDSASAQFAPSSYTINLRSWSGDKISRFINLYVPLATLLAGALPLSTGKQSYQSPFLCRLWDRGRNQIQLGMITALSITRGVGNLGFNDNTECLGIDVTFEITNLSSIMHAPIDGGGSYFDLLVTPWKKIMDEDSAFCDYMAIIGNLSLADQYYKKNKLALNLTRKREMYATAFTPAAIANALDISWPTRYIGYGIGALARSTERGN